MWRCLETLHQRNNGIELYDHSCCTCKLLSCCTFSMYGFLAFIHLSKKQGQYNVNKNKLDSKNEMSELWMLAVWYKIWDVWLNEVTVLTNPYFGWGPLHLAFDYSELSPSALAMLVPWRLPHQSSGLLSYGNVEWPWSIWQKQKTRIQFKLVVWFQKLH